MKQITYNETDFETGWNECGWIEVKSVSTYAFIDRFRCKGSNEPLEEESLFIERKNFKHRGNETDELHCYNRANTPSKYMNIWKEWDESKLDVIQRIKGLMRHYNLDVDSITV